MYNSGMRVWYDIAYPSLPRAYSSLMYFTAFTSESSKFSVTYTKTLSLAVKVLSLRGDRVVTALDQSVEFCCRVDRDGFGICSSNWMHCFACLHVWVYSFYYSTVMCVRNSKLLSVLGTHIYLRLWDACGNYRFAFVLIHCCMFFSHGEQSSERFFRSGL